MEGHGDVGIKKHVLLGEYTELIKYKGFFRRPTSRNRSLFDYGRQYGMTHVKILKMVFVVQTLQPNWFSGLGIS